MNTQDWDEIEALRASLREHMAEIHRLRAAGRQALEALENPWSAGPSGVADVITVLRAALTEDRSADTGKTSDVPETNFGNMAQSVDSKEDDHIPNAAKMMASVRESRTVEATIKQSLTVEPVAYVTGYFDGKCVIKPIEPVALPTGMALYRSPPKREPLTEKQIESAVCGAYVEKVLTRYDITIARAIERAHGIGGKE